MVDLNEFVEWSKNNPGCCVDIKIGGYRTDEAGVVESVWVFSGELMTGQHVTSIDEIDLEAEHRRKMESQKQEIEEYFRKTGAV